MAEHTKIEWARHPATGLGATWNIVTGCAVVSPGCTNCYAMKLAGTRLKHHPSRQGLTAPSKAGPIWTGETRFNEQWLTQPLGWKKPHGIFVAAHGDLFAEGVTDDQRDRIFAVMALCPQHIFFVLTKRPERMREYLAKQEHSSALGMAISFGAQANRILRDALRALTSLPDLPLPNVWLGVSVEDQPRAKARIPVLLDTPAALRFISAEPLLGPIDLESAWYGESALDSECWGDCGWCEKGLPPLHNCQRDQPRVKGGYETRSGLDWVIAGGESGPDARPSHPDWFRALRDQCREAGTAFFFKQWGAWAIASEENGHTDSAMATNDAIWLDIDGRRAKPSCNGMTDPIGMFKPGKKAAGNHLDGVQHLEFPELAPTSTSPLVGEDRQAGQGAAVPLAELGEGCA